MGSLTLYVNPPHWGFSSQIRAACGGVIHLHRIKKDILVIQETWVTRPIQKSFNHLTHWAVSIQTGPQIYGRHGSLAHYSPDIHTTMKLNPTHQEMVLVMNWLDNLWVGLQTCTTSFSARIPRDRRRRRRTGITLDNLLISASELHHSGGYSTLWFFLSEHHSGKCDDIFRVESSIGTSLCTTWWYCLSNFVAWLKNISVQYCFCNWQKNTFVKGSRWKNNMQLATNNWWNIFLQEQLPRNLHLSRQSASTW